MLVADAATFCAALTLRGQAATPAAPGGPHVRQTRGRGALREPDPVAFQRPIVGVAVKAGRSENQEPVGNRVEAGVGGLALTPLECQHSRTTRA